MAEITLDQIVKVYPGGVTAVDSLSLRIRDGEFMVLVGPSGCGKSTALRMIAGMEQISGGTVSIGATIVNDLPPKDRDIAMIFQNYALYPHMTVEQNMAFGLRMRKTPKREIDRRVKQAAALLGLEECLKRRPSALSGGQRQRVAMGRAIVREPKAFLMDEPLSNLDAKLRLSMRAALVQLHERLRTTTIFVTHDQVEAMTLGDRVCVMHDGQLQQVDTPQNLFDYPVNLFVASFIGSPAMNTVIARLSADDDEIAAEFAGYRLSIPRDTVRARPAVADYIGREVILGVRPSDFEDGRLTNEEWPRMQVTADVTEGLGNATHVIFTVDAPPPAGHGAAYADEQDDGVIPLAEGTSLWTARVSARSKAGPGDRMDLAVDTSRLHFFDPHSGKSIGLQQAAVTGG